MKRNYARRL